jgi:sugar/nucleoside kinase (ribokinase family)
VGMAGGPPPDVLVVGHVTRDVSPSAAEGYTFGGTATFASVAAQRLGHRVGLVTTCANDAGMNEALAGVDIVVAPSDVTTTFENIYTATGRIQFVRAAAPPINAASIPSGWRDSPVALLGPVAQEVRRDVVQAFGPRTTIAATLQGWVRTWDNDSGRVRPIPWADHESFLDRIDAVVFSPVDVGSDPALVRMYAERARLAIVTEAADGGVVWHRGNRFRYPAYEVEEVEPTGAGDAFAVAFALEFHATRDPEHSARYASCVASFVVEGHGTSCVPTIDAVRERFRHGRLRTH